MTLAVLKDQFLDIKVLSSDKIVRKQVGAVQMISGVSVRMFHEGSRLCCVKAPAVFCDPGA